MGYTESRPVGRTGIVEGVRTAARTPIGRGVVAALIALPAAVTASAYSGNNQSDVPKASLVVTTFDGRDLPCMSEAVSGHGLYDCDWYAYYGNTNYEAPSWVPRISLTEEDVSYGTGKVRCLKYGLALGASGLTCDWADPAIQNLAPTASQTEKVVTYNGHDKDCVAVQQMDGVLTEYSCNLDEPSSYHAASAIPRIAAGQLVQHTMTWDGLSGTVLVYAMTDGATGETADWASFGATIPSPSQPAG